VTPSRRSILLALAALLALGPAVVYAKGQKPKGTDGNYKTTVGGYYTGTGTASVERNNIVVRIKVTDEQGNKGEFKVTIRLNGAHFRGEGTVMGLKVKVNGRLDGYADAKGKGFQGARLLASYTDEKNNAGRVAGAIEAR
jgi:uncharacterized protein YpmS